MSAQPPITPASATKAATTAATAAPLAATTLTATPVAAVSATVANAAAAAAAAAPTTGPLVALSPTNPSPGALAFQIQPVTVPNTSGTVTFQLVITDNLGQSSTAQTTVTIQPGPNIEFTATPTVAAPGSTITLSAAGSSAAAPGALSTFQFSLVTPGAVPTPPGNVGVSIAAAPTASTAAAVPAASLATATPAAALATAAAVKTPAKPVT
jgi:hypothetical protein